MPIVLLFSSSFTLKSDLDDIAKKFGARQLNLNWTNRKGFVHLKKSNHESFSLKLAKQEAIIAIEDCGDPQISHTYTHTKTPQQRHS